MIAPTPTLSALPTLVPFIGPETLAREAGISVGSLLRLGANESCFGPAPAVLAAIEEELSDIGCYGDPSTYDLRTLLAEEYWTEPGRIIVASGIDELLGLFVRAYLGPIDVAVMTRGSYPTFAFHVAGCGARLHSIDYHENHHDLPALTDYIKRERPRMLYLANPDNPSGALLPAPELDAFLENLPDDCLVLLDEAYAEYAPEALPVTTRPEVIRLRTFSKAYGMASLRVGYAFAAPETIAACEKIRLHFGVGRLSQAAACMALRRPAYVGSVVAQTEQGRVEYANFGQELGITTYPSATNFVLFEIGSVTRAEKLVKELLRRGIFVRKPAIGVLASCIRITVGTADQRRRLRLALHDALESIDTE